MRYTDVLKKNSSRIILGTAYFGDGISEEDSFALMDEFYRMGGTHIDTARLYADGVAEEIVGRWLSKNKDKEIFLATKGGYPTNDLPDKIRISNEEIRYDLEKSLTALNVECVDFYWLHRDDGTTPVSQIIDMMNLLVKEGKIKHFGASNWTSERIAEAQKYASENGLSGFCASQIRFNPASVTRERSGLVGMDKKEFEYYHSTNMPVVAYSSQAKGFFSKMAELGEDFISPKARARYMCEENLNKLEVLKKLSKKYDCSIGALICAAFSSFEKPVVFPVVGCSRLEQLRDSMSGADIVLTQEEINMIFDGVIR